MRTTRGLGAAGAALLALTGCELGVNSLKVKTARDLAPSKSGAPATTLPASATGADQGGGGSNAAPVVSQPLILPPAGNTPPEVLGTCASLPEVGKFQEITPPEVKAGFGKVQDGGGMFAIAADPINHGTFYVGTLFQGLWKSTDCGATWDKIATGRSAKEVNSGMNWTLAVDHEMPNIVYTNSGYYANGLFKSTDGGTNWDVIWPPAKQPELSAAFEYNFANILIIDPKNSAHILLTFHEACRSTPKTKHNSVCIAESSDRGETWRLVEGGLTPEGKQWNGGEGQVLYFLGDSQSWIWGSSVNGFYVTHKSGAGDWEQVPGLSTVHMQGTQMVRTKKGNYFIAGSDVIWTSPSGEAPSWKRIPDTGHLLGGIIYNGFDTVYASTCYAGGFCAVGQPRYLKSSDEGKTWTVMPNAPALNMGGSLAYDKGHQVMMSSNGQAGLWRVRLPKPPEQQ